MATKLIDERWLTMLIAAKRLQDRLYQFPGLPFQMQMMREFRDSWTCQLVTGTSPRYHWNTSGPYQVSLTCPGCRVPSKVEKMVKAAEVAVILNVYALGNVQALTLNHCRPKMGGNSDAESAFKRSSGGHVYWRCLKEHPIHSYPIIHNLPIIIQGFQATY